MSDNETSDVSNNTNSLAYCNVKGCHNSSQAKPFLSFFKFPKDAKRRAQWLELIDREDLADGLVCETHFHPSAINQNKRRKLLKPTALPLLCVPASTTKTNGSSQTETLIGTIICKNIGAEQSGSRKRVRVVDKEVNKESMFLNLCDQFLTKEFAELVKTHVTLSSFKSNKNYNHLAFKKYCLNLLYASPQGYIFLEKAMSLPSINSLKRLNIPMTTKIGGELLDILKLKVNNMSKKEKICTVMVGAASTLKLKEHIFYDIKNDRMVGFLETDDTQTPKPATHALVVLVRGLLVDWHHPVTYCFIVDRETNDDMRVLHVANLKNWIDKLLLTLLQIGLDVKAFVTDPFVSEDLSKAVKKLGISVENTHRFINGQKIYFFYDAPSLLILLRNYFMKYNFHSEDGTAAKFEHIVKFHEHDKSKRCRQVPKLKKRHLKPSKEHKTKVVYAMQLLSASVAAGISSNMDHWNYDHWSNESAKATVTFIKNMNDLFDVLNSSKSHDAFCGNSQQIEMCNKMMLYFNNLGLIHSANGTVYHNCEDMTEGFQITIRSLLLLFEDLKQVGYKYVLTRRLNLEILPKFMQKVKTNIRKTTAPTGWQFVKAFRKIYFRYLIHPPKEGNSVGDLGSTLVHLKDINSLTDADNELVKEDLRVIKCAEYNKLEVPQKKAFSGICGALLRLCAARHSGCLLLKSYQKRGRKIKRNGLQMVVPSHEFENNISGMEEAFQKTFERDRLVASGIGMSLYEEIKRLPFTLPCSCFPKQYLQKLYVRMRIYFFLISNNRAIRDARKT